MAKLFPQSDDVRLRQLALPRSITLRGSTIPGAPVIAHADLDLYKNKVVLYGDVNFFIDREGSNQAKSTGEDWIGIGCAGTIRNSRSIMSRTSRWTSPVWSVIPGRTTALFVRCLERRLGLGRTKSVAGIQ